MKRFIGFCNAKQGSPVVGKLIFPRRDNGSASRSACLAVLREDEPFPEDGAVVGVIRIGNPSDPLSQSAAFPCPVLTLSSLSESYHGQIALLDPTEAALFISPDLETVTRYSQELRPLHEVSQAPSYLRSFTVSSAEQMNESENDGWLILPPSIPSESAEEVLYEQYRDIADRAVGAPVTAVISVSHPISPDTLRESLRALFRSAVYGRFSLLLQGILTDTALRACLKELHRVFCELESEGREYNGYIPKGIVVDTPFFLWDAPPLDGIDTLCFDLPRLGKHLSGGLSWETDLDLKEGIFEILFHFASRYPKVKRTAILPSRTSESDLLPHLSRLKIKEAFFPIHTCP